MVDRTTLPAIDGSVSMRRIKFGNRLLVTAAIKMVAIVAAVINQPNRGPSKKQTASTAMTAA